MGRIKKRRNDISILFVLDEKKEPIDIKLSYTAFKSILISIGFILLFIIFGAVYYFRVLGILADYENMKQKTKQAEEFKKIVYRMAKKFEGIERTDSQIRKLLGVNEVSGDSGDKEISVKNAEKEKEMQDMEMLSNEISLVNKSDLVEQGTLEKHSISSRFIPYNNPVVGFISNHFQKDNLLTGENHTGIDIVAKEGSIIRAVADGNVLFSNWTYEWGNMIIIDHLNGFVSFYKHNKRNLAVEKSFIKKGQPIALMGNSGVSSGTHLHFELWKNGEPVDPKEYIINL